jgi:hypothetical protein
MSNHSETNAQAEQRRDRGRWAAMAFALLIVLHSIVLSALTWAVPGDGS